MQAGISRTNPDGIDGILSETGIEAEVDVNTTCTLEDGMGRAEPCSGPSCAFWLAEAHENRCVLEGVERELLARPRVADYLLTLRSNLEEAARQETHGR